LKRRALGEEANFRDKDATGRIPKQETGSCPM
jgi:DNA-binding CsgD family transcriptional regulator